MALGGKIGGLPLDDDTELVEGLHVGDAADRLVDQRSRFRAALDESAGALLRAHHAFVAEPGQRLVARAVVYEHDLEAQAIALHQRHLR